MSTTEAEAVAALAAQPVAAPVVVGDVERLALPAGWTAQIIDHEKLAATPRRASGRIVVRDAAGFVQAVKQRADGLYTLYADDDALALSAVLNDDQGATAGWRDHVVALELRKRPEWLHWTSLDGRLVEQKTFALHIEDGLKEIVSPTAADMLDLAQTFQATTAAKFKGGNRLANGERQFVYEEEIDAKAGAGQVAIPDSFTLRIAPFFGGEPVEIVARFRYQLRQSELTLGYKLDRPDEVALAAFTAITDAVAGDLGQGLIAGATPMQR